MIDVRAGGYSLRSVLTAIPKISDQTDGVCRTLTLQVKNSKEIKHLMGQTVEMYNGAERLFIGKIRRRGLDIEGSASLLAYDPLFHFKKNTDDYYYAKGTMTATKIFKDLAERTGIKVGDLANTKVVLPALFYRGGEPNKIAVDTLARTKAAGGKNFWFRYDPSVDNEGLQLFERIVPIEVWAFQLGVNLTDASYEESAEELFTQVKLVNRETGKVVIKQNKAAYDKYGQTQHFEEVDKEGAANMERQANSLIKQVSQVAVTSSIAGVNNGDMPMFFSGDVVYVEDKNTGLIGAYHIRNVDQEYVSKDLINVAMDITKAAGIPDIEYDSATTDPRVKEAATAAKKDATAKKKAAAAEKKKAAAKKKADKAKEEQG